MEKIALLSNVNVNFVNRKLKKSFTVYETEGYGNELGTLLDPASSLQAFSPEAVFLLMDLAELTGHETDLSLCREKLDEWFAGLSAALQDQVVYFLSDAYWYGEEKEALPDARLFALESLYQERLQNLTDRHSNVRLFPLRRLIGGLGEEQSFCRKTWYLGKILFSNELQERLARQIEKCMRAERQTPKKVLVLDLDNTLWGGLAGNYPQEELQLSDEHEGLYYQNAQRIIRGIKDTGVLLCIASKNNEADAMRVLREHPHMVLRPADFAAYRIGWGTKDQSLRELSQELNLGLDSFVFWDDEPTERELIRQMLPQVNVPEFPEKPENMCDVLLTLYETYFRKNRLTDEDMVKTEAYAQNRKREKWKEGNTYEDYLKGLSLVLERVDARQHLDRLHQLFQKTNQFNLTTHRYELAELKKIVEDSSKRVYLYRVEDRFGDYGIVAALIADVSAAAQLTDFVMSCRVMGKRVEYAIMTQVERELFTEGQKVLLTRYLPTAKNMPVKDLFEQLGYEKLSETADGEKKYRLSLEKKQSREYFVTIQNG